MDTWKKIVIGYYILLTSVTFAVVLMDGYGALNFTEGNVTHIITLFSVAICPVVITAIRAKEFWRDDPDSVARKNKEISNIKVTHSQEKTNMLLQNQKVVDHLQNTNAQLEKELKNRPKPLIGKRKPPANI